MSEAVPPPDPLIGKTVRAYRIQEVIGTGRWGTVYRAFQSSINRTAALRVLRQELAGLPGNAEQFLEKSRSQARLIHPNLVIVYEAGRADNLHFCAMECLDGPPLREFLRKNNVVDEHHLLLAVSSLARVLDFLWQEQVQHQPPLEQNVLTTVDGTVKLTNIDAVGVPASQSPHEDLLRLGLMIAGVANDISPVSRPVGRLVERILGAAGHEAFASLSDAAEAAEALDRRMFGPTPKMQLVTSGTGPSGRKWLMIAAGLIVVCIGLAVLAWLSHHPFTR